MKKIVGSLTPKGTCTFLTVPVSPWAGGCKTGDYLLVAYGERGAQLAYVTHADPDRKTLQILRLVNRGKRNAKWKPSKLSRFDARILGKSAPLPQDPPLAAKLTLGENKVVLPLAATVDKSTPHPEKTVPNNTTPEAMTIDATTAETIFNLLRKHWPTLQQSPDTEVVRVLNHIQKIVEKEGLEALTPARFRGLKEIFEEVIWTDPIHG